MYKLTCCRWGNGPYFNIRNKGKFTKYFSTLSEVALFIHKSKGALFYPRLNQEYSSKERTILYNKLGSLRLK